MSREIRRVPKNWEHPKDEKGKYIPLFSAKDYELACRESGRALEELDSSDMNEQETVEGSCGTFRMDEYMVFDEEPTHYQLYERTTEGTPLSPVFESIEALLKYAAKYCRGWGGSKLSLEAWKEMLT